MGFGDWKPGHLAGEQRSVLTGRSTFVPAFRIDAKRPERQHVPNRSASLRKLDRMLDQAYAVANAGKPSEIQYAYALGFLSAVSIAGELDEHQTQHWQGVFRTLLLDCTYP